MNEQDPERAYFQNFYMGEEDIQILGRDRLMRELPNRPDSRRAQPNPEDPSHRQLITIGHSIIENNREHLHSLGEIDYALMPGIIKSLLSLNNRELAKFLGAKKQDDPILKGEVDGMRRDSLETMFLTARFWYDFLPIYYPSKHFHSLLREPQDYLGNKSILEKSIEMPKLAVGAVYKQMY